MKVLQFGAFDDKVYVKLDTANVNKGDIIKPVEQYWPSFKIKEAVENIEDERDGYYFYATISSQGQVDKITTDWCEYLIENE